MADFALFASAAEPVMAPRGAFMRAYLRNVELAQELVLESSLVAPHVIKLVDDSGDNWKGTTQELLAALNKRAHESGADGETKDKSWPKNPHRLGGILRRLAVALLAKGIRYTEPDRHTKARLLQLQRVGITKEPKAPKGNPQNGKDLSGADAGAVVDLVPNDNGTGADNGAVGADMVPNHFPEKGTTQPTENTAASGDGAVGAVRVPAFTHNDQGDAPMCPKCLAVGPEKLAGGGNRCRACGHKFRDGDAFVRG
jgi:hypothetical protein